MNATDAHALGARICECVEAGSPAQALALIEPVLRPNVLRPRQIDDLGVQLAGAEPDDLREFLLRVARTHTPQGWRLAGAALAEQLDHAVYATLATTRELLRQSPSQAEADRLASRVLAPALARYSNAAIAVLSEWPSARSPQVRRALAVAVSDWAAAGEARAAQAAILLDLLSPLVAGGDAAVAGATRSAVRAIAERWPRPAASWARARAHSGRQPGWVTRLTGE